MKHVSAEDMIAKASRPFTGAWIETCMSAASASTPKSPLHGGVD